MADDRRFLIGRGETLTRIVEAPGRLVQDKFHPYTFADARRHIAPQVRHIAASLRDLPEGACPNDQAVAMLTIHPSYLAKSYYPNALLKAIGLHPIGSRTASVRVRKGTSRQMDKTLATAELYVAGKRKSFSKWADELSTWSEVRTGASELVQLEDVYAEKPIDRIRDLESLADCEYFEVVVQMTSKQRDILAGFRDYVVLLDGKALVEKSQQIGGLCYVPVAIDSSVLVDLAKFTFMRGLRRMPELRAFLPFRASSQTFAPILPSNAAVNPHLRVAVLDGGMPVQPDLSRWVNSYDADKVGPPLAAGLDHGIRVTSALLFGPLEDGEPVPNPFALVEHHRIADVNMKAPDFYDLLPRVEAVLKASHYDYVNLSMGPHINVDDSLVHVWTAKLDELLSHGKTLAFIAAGNLGRNRKREEQRIGPPGDAVNGFTIGACDSTSQSWEKATYSSIGPGRSSAVIKPDVIAFGGEPGGEEFGALQGGLPITAAGICGTSYASPYALRTALGAAAHFGYALHPLAVKALLIHHAVQARHHTVGDVGWGRIPRDYEQLVTCSPDVAQIVYQGILKPGKYLRAPIPVPSKFGNGPVYITATICFATETEPQNTVSYTRAGLEVYFRPHANQRTDPQQRNADTAPFFRSGDLRQAEGTLRTDALKWETTLKKTRRFNDPASLLDPAFDIHYVAREEGAGATDPADIPYAMIVGVRQKGFAHLYDRIVARYRGVLEPLVPGIRVPVRVMPGEA